jgi:hypothetical protein
MNTFKNRKVMSFSLFKWFKIKPKKQELVKSFRVYSGNEFIGCSYFEDGNPVVQRQLEFPSDDN